MRQVEESIKEIDYNGEKIQYILKRDKIKNLYIQIPIRCFSIPALKIIWFF